MRRFITATVLALTMALATSGVVSAITASISPGYQNHAHGVASHWNLSWGGTQPFDVYFIYDVIHAPTWGWWINGTATTSKSLSVAFYPCSTTNFQQQFTVYDMYNSAVRTSHAYENGGNPC